MTTLQGQDTAQINSITAQKQVTIFSWFLCKNNPLTLIRIASLEKESPSSFQNNHGVVGVSRAEEVGNQK